MKALLGLRNNTEKWSGCSLEFSISVEKNQQFSVFTHREFAISISRQRDRVV